MSLYLDTSCLLKVFLVEPESLRVRDVLVQEPRVVVSTLVRLEAAQRFHAVWLGGEISGAQHRRLSAKIRETLSWPPFEVVAFPPVAVEICERQLATEPYCRTLDRLHLGAMEALGLERLLTNDAQQAAAARALGFDVIMPR